MKRKTKNKKRQPLQDILKLFPVIFAISIIPLLVRFTVYDPQLSEYTWFKMTSLEADFFMICKQSAMYFLLALVVCGIIQLALNKELPWQKAFIPLTIYATLIVFSTFVSVSPHHSLNGFYNMMESAGVLVGYCAICYYAYAIVKSEQQLKIILFALSLSIVVISLIGITQMCGTDFLLSDIGKFFVFPSEYAAYRDNIQQNFAGTVSSTLFNPNYVGVYTSLVIPIFLTLAFSTKKPVHLIFYTIVIGLGLTILIGSGSKTAFIILIPCFLFLIFYIGRQIGKKIIPIILLVLVVITGLTIYQGENSLLANVLDKLTVSSAKTQNYHLKNITLNDEDYIINWKDEDIKVTYNTTATEHSISIYDSAGNLLPVEYHQKNKYYQINDDYYEDLYFIPLIINNQQVGYTIQSQNLMYPICYSTANRTYYYLNEYGRYTKLYDGEMIDLPVFHIMGGFSGRDFIWQHSLPLLKQTVFLGSGPDTYSFMFPQYDYISKIQDNRESILITKPHNTYLQIGIQTGVLSLIAYIVFYVLYAIDSIRLYFKRPLNSFSERLGAGIFIGSLCFMISGLLHDSTIGVSVVYWTLIGLGFCCNRLVKETDGKQIEFINWRLPLKPIQTLALIVVVSIVIFAGHFITNA